MFVLCISAIQLVNKVMCVNPRQLKAPQNGDSPLSQRTVIANGLYCHVMHKLLYPSIRARTAPPVSVRVRVRLVLVLVLRCNAIVHTILHCVPRTFAIATLCVCGPESSKVSPSQRTLLSMRKSSGVTIIYLARKSLYFFKRCFFRNNYFIVISAQ